MGKPKSQKTVTPDSVPSLADSSHTSSHDDDVEVNRILFLQKDINATPCDNDLAKHHFFQTDKSKVYVKVSPDGTAATNTTYGSEMLSIGSEEDSGVLHVSSDNTSFRTSNCVNVVPVFANDPETIKSNDDSEENSSKIMKKDTDAKIWTETKAEISNDGNDDVPSPAFCSDRMMMPSRDMFRMFDLSPRVWQGWTFSSPSPEDGSTAQPRKNVGQIVKSQFHQILDGYSDSGSSPTLSSPNTIDSPLVQPHKVIYGWHPPQRDISVDPVIEVTTTPPRSSKTHRRQELYVTTDQKRVSSDGLIWQDSPYSFTADSGVETTVTSNIDVAGTKSWERKVDDLERACATLKEIIRSDSKVMLQLKMDIAHLRQATNHNNLKHPPSIGLLAELHRVKAERDKFLDRELNYIETIAKLQEELSELQTTQVPLKDVEALRLENKVLLERITEHENEMNHWKSQLIFVAQENAYLKTQLFEAKARVDSINHTTLAIEKPTTRLESNRNIDLSPPTLDIDNRHTSDVSDRFVGKIDKGAAPAISSTHSLRQQLELLANKISQIEMCQGCETINPTEQDPEVSATTNKNDAGGMESDSLSITDKVLVPHTPLVGEIGPLEEFVNEEENIGIDQLILSLDCYNDNDSTVRVKNRHQRSSTTDTNHEVEVTLEGMIITTAEATYCCDDVYEKDRYCYYDSAPKRRRRFQMRKRYTATFSDTNSGGSDSNKENKDPTRTLTSFWRYFQARNVVKKGNRRVETERNRLSIFNWWPYHRRNKVSKRN